MAKMVKTSLFALFAAATMTGVYAQDPAVKADVPAATAEEEEKTQTITFVQDDDQSVVQTKIYELKHTKAADLAPFVRSAVIRRNGSSTVVTMEDAANKRQLLIVSTSESMFEYVDEMIAALDRSAKMVNGTNVAGTGIAYGTYKPQFRSSADMRKIVVGGQVASSKEDARVRLDKKTGMFYFKDTPYRVEDIKRKLAWLDKPGPQARVELTIYEVRESDLKDIGLDYLAWKNGPGMNLLSVGYDALNLRAAETIMEGIDLFGNFTYGFGGMYTAPAFDFSFIRILQQNGKATVNSSAMLTITNTADKEFKATFSPEYQNIEKDEDHMTTVGVGGDATLDVVITEPVITGGKNGVVNFTYSLYGSNVVERNNMGAEIAETTEATASTSLNYNQEKLLMNWERVSEVEQTIGIPVLCELPILKYIFGTTTTNQEKTYYFVTARAVPVAPDDSIPQGVLKAFDELAKQYSLKEKEK